MIKICLNDQPLIIAEGLCLKEILSAQGYTTGQYAVVINQAVVPAALYTSTILKEGDDIKIIIPMQGG